MRLDTTFIQFAEQWIEKNVSSETYPGMRKYVLELARVLHRQRHSGASGAMALRYFSELNRAWDHPEESES